MFSQLHMYMYIYITATHTKNRGGKCVFTVAYIYVYIYHRHSHQNPLTLMPGCLFSHTQRVATHNTRAPDHTDVLPCVLARSVLCRARASATLRGWERA